MHLCVPQSAWRGHAGRQTVVAVRQERAAVVVQKYWRRAAAVAAYRSAVRCASVFPELVFADVCGPWQLIHGTMRLHLHLQ